MLIFSEEGELVEDASNSEMIPQMMNEGSFRVARGKLYPAAGGRENTLSAFDGKKWEKIDLKLD